METRISESSSERVRKIAKTNSGCVKIIMKKSKSAKCNNQYSPPRKKSLVGWPTNFSDKGKSKREARIVTCEKFKSVLKPRKVKNILPPFKDVESSKGLNGLRCGENVVELPDTCPAASKRAEGQETPAGDLGSAITPFIRPDDESVSELQVTSPPGLSSRKLNSSRGSRRSNFGPQHFALRALQIGLLKIDWRNKSHKFANAKSKLLFGKRKLTYEFDQPLSANGEESLPSSTCLQVTIEIAFSAITNLNTTDCLVALEVDTQPYMSCQLMTSEENLPIALVHSSLTYQREFEHHIQSSPYHWLTLADASGEDFCSFLCNYEGHFRDLLSKSMLIDTEKSFFRNKNPPASSTRDIHQRTGKGSSAAVVPLRCSCLSGCLQTRCGCIRSTKPCSEFCRCSSMKNCRNPLNYLEESGVKGFMDDQCFMDNLHSVHMTRDFLEQPVFLDCCGVSVAKLKLMPGIVKCPGKPSCTKKYRFSWCAHALYDGDDIRRYHCKKCGNCTGRRDIHCKACDSCHHIKMSCNPTKRSSMLCGSVDNKSLTNEVTRTEENVLQVEEGVRPSSTDVSISQEEKGAECVTDEVIVHTSEEIDEISSVHGNVNDCEENNVECFAEDVMVTSEQSAINDVDDIVVEDLVTVSTSEETTDNHIDKIFIINTENKFLFGSISDLQEIGADCIAEDVIVHTSEQMAVDDDCIVVNDEKIVVDDENVVDDEMIVSTSEEMTDNHIDKIVVDTEKGFLFGSISDLQNIGAECIAEDMIVHASEDTVIDDIEEIFVDVEEVSDFGNAIAPKDASVQHGAGADADTTEYDVVTTTDVEEDEEDEEAESTNGDDVATIAFEDPPDPDATELFFDETSTPSSHNNAKHFEEENNILDKLLDVSSDEAFDWQGGIDKFDWMIRKTKFLKDAEIATPKSTKPSSNGVKEHYVKEVYILQNKPFGQLYKTTPKKGKKSQQYKNIKKGKKLPWNLNLQMPFKVQPCKPSIQFVSDMNVDLRDIPMVGNDYGTGDSNSELREDQTDVILNAFDGSFDGSVDTPEPTLTEDLMSEIANSGSSLDSIPYTDFISDSCRIDLPCLDDITDVQYQQSNDLFYDLLTPDLYPCDSSLDKRISQAYLNCDTDMLKQTSFLSCLQNCENEVSCLLTH